MLSKKSTVEEIMKDPKGKEIIEKYFGDKLNDPRVKMAMGLSLEKLGDLAADQMPKSMIDDIHQELMNLSEVVNIEPEKISSVQRSQEINSGWLFTKESTDEMGEGLGFEEINLPHTWNLEDGNTGGSDYYRGLCTYKKTLSLSEDYKGKQLFLEFGAANSVAKVYVNGNLAGSHIGGYSLFRVEITNLVSLTETNTIVVHVDNSHIEEVYPLMADFTFFGGLYRGVNLVAVNPVHMSLDDFGSEGIYITQRDVSHEKAVIDVECLVSNNSGSVKTVEVDYVLKDQEGHEVISKSLKSAVTEKTSFNESLEVEAPTLWHSTKNPYLYELITTLKLDGDILETKVNHVGLRYFEVHPEKGFFLNGESMKLNGVSRHQDRSGRGWAISEKDQVEDIEIIKEMGANSIRLAHYQHSPYFYELCDKYGMVVWAEIPLISRSSKTDVTGENAKLQMIELIKQNYNNSSIVFWGVQNETTMSGKMNRLEEITQELHDLTKKLDPYRLTTQAQVGHHPDEDSMNNITDVLGYNKYYGWYYNTCEDFEVWLNNFKEINPGISLGISEYGCEGILDYHTENPAVNDYTEEYQALYHEKVLQIFNAHDEIWGTYVWNMFDFASDLRDEGGVKGMNNKGLVTYDRKTRKDSFYYYKAMWSTDHVLHITSKRFEQRIENNITIKVYSNIDEVKLTVNGQKIDTLNPVHGVVKFENVVLEKGKNKIVVEAGNMKDEAEFDHVDELTVNYECPEGGNIFVANWFGPDLVLDEDIKPLEYPEGYFTALDPITEILANPEGEAVLRKYIGPLFENSMFEIAKTFSLKMIQDFDKNIMNDVMLYNISKELNKVKK